MSTNNHTFLIGFLGKDPEVRQTEKGDKMALFSVCTNDGKDITNWHNIAAFKGAAELVEKWFKKGDAIVIEGMNVSRSSDGKHYYSVHANKIGFPPSKRSTNENKETSNQTNDLPF